MAMKTASLKNAFVTASFLVAVGHTGIASAHSQTGALASKARATDLYRVTCSTDAGGETYRLPIRVRDEAPVKKPLVSAQIRKGSLATNTTDAKDGNTAYSPRVYTNGGNGVYYVTVTKTGKGAERYTLEYHCQTETGGHTGTDITTLQNE